MVDLARSHTTVSVERAVLRLAGVSGADPDGIPWVNRLVDAVAGDVGLAHGVAVPVFHALAAKGSATSRCWRRRRRAGSVRFTVPTGRAAAAARRAAPASGRPAASGRSTGAGPSGSGWSSGTATRRSGRGST